MSWSFTLEALSFLSTLFVSRCFFGSVVLRGSRYCFQMGVCFRISRNWFVPIHFYYLDGCSALVVCASPRTPCRYGLRLIWLMLVLHGLRLDCFSRVRRTSSACGIVSFFDTSGSSVDSSS
ncbi:hypothetical protein H4582DRAFT_1590173 [Lactarius indigo]|nr:hypothetical protein H4582DRAFT_1590173 [Lactarius indigo]